MDLGSDSDSYPDIHEAFAHYNSLYFDDAIGACTLSWTDSRNHRSIGTCRYLEGGECEIFLGKQLKLRSATELKNTLLHEMIHAFLYITEKKRDHSYHGPSFTARAEAINHSSKVDPMRPSCGYNITISHSLSKEVDDKRIQHWTCTSCGDVIEGSANKEPSASYCLEKMVADNFCGNNSCHWHRHKKLCSGKYIINKPGYKGKKTMSPNGTHDDKGDRSAVLPSTKKLPARQLKLSESMDNSSNVKKLNSINGFPDLENIGNEPTGKIPKRPRTTWIRREDKKVIQDSKEAIKDDHLSSWFDDEESDKDIQPLINKRTERRKIEKLMKLKWSHSEVESVNIIKKCTGGDCVLYISDDD